MTKPCLHKGKEIDVILDNFSRHPELLRDYLLRVQRRVDEANKLAGENALMRTRIKKAQDQLATSREVEFVSAAEAVLATYGYVHHDHDLDCGCSLCRLKRAIR